MSDFQADFWNGVGGERWSRFYATLDAQHGAVTDLLMTRAGDLTGQSVLDVGAGQGTLATRLAARAAHVTGVDISEPILEVARGRVPGNVDLVLADAAAFDPGDRCFDLIVSQFGVMLFEDNAAGFAHLHGCAAPGGRLLFAAWAAPAKNPWFSMPRRVVAEAVGDMDSDPDGPGPFRLQDAEATRVLLEGAGWREVGVDEVALPLTPPGTRHEVARFAIELGGAGGLLRHHGADEATRSAILARIEAELAPYDTGAGIVVPGVLILAEALV